MSKVDLTKYYEEICKKPMLSTEEEQRLFKVYYSKDTTSAEKEAARKTVIESNLRFAFKKAKNFAKQTPEMFDELILAGNEGLIVGFDKYDPNSGVKFLTYAGWWVMQRQYDTMSKMRIVALPVYKQQLAQKILRLQERQEKQLTVKELQALLPDVSEKDIKELSETKYLTYYLDDLDDVELTVSPIEEEVEEEIQNASIERLIGTLPELNQKIIKLVFGFDDGDEQNDSAISKLLNIPKSTVKKLRVESLEILRNNKLSNLHRE